MNKTTALLASCALSLALAACGGSGADTPAPAAGSTAEPAGAEAVEQTEAVEATEDDEAPEEASLDAWTPAYDFSAAPTTNPVDVATIDPGWLPFDNGDAGTSDIWYVDGQEGNIGIYLTKANNDAARSLTFVDEDKEETDSVWYLDIQDNHLVNQDGHDETAVDIVFLDSFNCYDYATGTWYSRGNQAYFEGLIAGHSLTVERSDGNSDSYELAADGTFLRTNTKLEPETGTWRVCGVNVIELAYDNDDYSQQIRFEIAADGTLTFLDLFSDYQLI